MNLCGDEIPVKQQSCEYRNRGGDGGCKGVKEPVVELWCQGLTEVAILD